MKLLEMSLTLVSTWDHRKLAFLWRRRAAWGDVPYRFGQMGGPGTLTPEHHLSAVIRFPYWVKYYTVPVWDLLRV